MVAYAVLMIGLGVYATAVHGEIMSLVGGGGAGAIVLGMMFWSLKNPRPAYIISLVIGVALIGQFAMKFVKGTGTLYPHGLIILLNVLLVAALLGGHLTAMAAKKSGTAAG